jgi:transketolase
MKTANQRRVYGEALVELGKENPHVVACDADLCKSTMSYLFQDTFPKRYFEMGIGEQNMAAFAVGLALTGKIPFVHSFAAFAVGRCYEQIRVSVCIGGFNVRIIGSSAGLSDFADGATHQSFEDISLMRSLPNMTILAPADGNEVRRMVRFAALHQGPIYMRLNRNDVPDVIPEQGDFVLGKPTVLRNGKDAVVFAHGIMVSRALEAADELGEEGIDVRVVNVSTIKPIDEEEIANLAAGTRCAVAAEEHSIYNGLGAVVTSALRGRAIPVGLVGIQDRFGQSAKTYDELLAHYGLTADRIASTVRKSLI